MGKTLLVLLVLAGCQNIVPQDRSTGPDGKIRGALPIELQDGAGGARGIVTYPGGDRVDWKKIVLPAKMRGTLDLEMSYSTPRPGLKVSFDVFDQWHLPVKQAVTRKGATKAMSIQDAKGTYFVRIYAQRRGDAGTYKLNAQFAGAPEGGDRWAPEVLPVPGPPRIPDVPEPPAAAPTSCPVYDASNPICAKTCAPGSPTDHKPCAAPPPPPPPPPTPVTGRVMKVEASPDGGVLVFVGAGSDNGVGKDWKTGTMLRGTSQNKVSGAVVTVIRVDKRTTIVKITGATPDLINQNPNVKLEP